MRFLDPLLLAGLAAAALPILIHLINRRRARQHRFAALELVLRSHRRTASRYRLRQILLLVVRTLALVAIPFALARPYLLTATGATVLPDGRPTSLVLVVDDSMSMRWSDGGETLLERAVDEARTVLAGMSDGDEAALVLAGSPPRAPVADRTSDREALGRALDAIAPTWRRTDLAGAISMAAGLLEGSPHEARRVVLISDLQAAGFEPAGLPGEGGPEVVVVDVAPEGGGANRAVVGIVAEPAPEADPGAWRFDAMVRASGSGEAVEVPISLELDGSVAARGFVRASPGEVVHKVFRVALPEGGVRRGRIALEADGLPGDDGRDFSVRSRPSLRVLLVNGDPRGVPYEDEVLYLEKALRPSAGGGSRLRPQVVLPAALADTDLATYDVVILANVGEVPDGVSGKLLDRIDRGGGLVVTAGDRMTPDRLGWAAPLLPAVVREVWASGPESGREPLRVETAAGTLALQELFAGAGGEGLRSAAVRRHLLLEPSLEPDRRVLLALSDGSPLLSERRVGRGRVLLLTTSADLDWSDLAASTAFLPLVQELCYHAAGAGVRARLPEAESGGAATVGIPDGARSAEVTDPDGRRRVVGPARVEGSAELTLEDASQPGLYTVAFSDAAGALVGERDLVVVPPAEESDLTPLPEEIGAALAGGAADVRDGAGASPERRTNLWPWALLILVLLLLSEASLLVRRRARRAPGALRAG